MAPESAQPTKPSRHKATLRSEQRFEPSAAYFLSLTVENIRCFGEAQMLDLSDGEGRPARWTVLLGDNGVGKTTLLECLALLQPVPFTSEGYVNRALPRITHPSYGALTWLSYFRHGSRERSYVHAACGAPPAPSSIRSEVFYGRALSTCGGGGTTGVLWAEAVPSGTGVSSRHHTVGYNQLAGLVCYGYGASRRPGTATLSRGDLQDTCASLFSAEAPLISAEEWLLRAEHKAMYEAASSNSQARQQSQAQRDRVTGMLVDFLPDVEDVHFVDVGETVAEYICLVQTPYGTVRMSALSLGYRTTIAWMVDLAGRLSERYHDSPNPIAGPAVALVDEIDLHMHPKWQRDIMRYLTDRFPNTQFIVTAHSPLVVQAAEGANVAVLRREGDHVLIENDPEIVKGWRIDQVLTSDLFDLESARPPSVEAVLAERRKLLAKPKLTSKDKARLLELEAQIGQLPTAETPEGREAMGIILRAAEELKRQGKGS